MYHMRKLILLVILAAVTSSCGWIPDQSRQEIAVGGVGAKEIGPEIQGKADGKTQPLTIADGYIEFSIKSQSFPDIWLVFPSERNSTSPGKEPTIKVELSSDAKSLLLSHWQVALSFCYNTELLRPPNAQSAFDLDMAFTYSVTATQRELEKLSIDAPDGKRNICNKEAMSLTRFLTLAASNIVKQSKSHT